MTTLKEFEEALREQGMKLALSVLENLRERDRMERTISPARRVSGRKMTPDLAQEILLLHRTTEMTQQEIAFRLGVNQGRVNEVIKHGKWLEDNPHSPEATARDKAMDRARKGIGKKARSDRQPRPNERTSRRRKESGQLTLGDF